MRSLILTTFVLVNETHSFEDSHLQVVISTKILSHLVNWQLDKHTCHLWSFLWSTDDLYIVINDMTNLLLDIRVSILNGWENLHGCFHISGLWIIALCHALIFSGNSIWFLWFWLLSWHWLLMLVFVAIEFRVLMMTSSVSLVITSTIILIVVTTMMTSSMATTSLMLCLVQSLLWVDVHLQQRLNQKRHLW